jgi:hypothetical protein
MRLRRRKRRCVGDAGSDYFQAADTLWSEASRHNITGMDHQTGKRSKATTPPPDHGSAARGPDHARLSDFSSTLNAAPAVQRLAAAGPIHQNGTPRLETATIQCAAVEDEEQAQGKPVQRAAMEDEEQLHGKHG